VIRRGRPSLSLHETSEKDSRVNYLSSHRCLELVPDETCTAWAGLSIRSGSRTLSFVTVFGS